MKDKRVIATALQKIYDAYKHFNDTQKLQWNVNPDALFIFLCCNEYVALPDIYIKRNGLSYVGLLGYRQFTYVYVSAQLAKGLAELVDPQTGDTVTIDVGKAS